MTEGFVRNTQVKVLVDVYSHLRIAKFLSDQNSSKLEVCRVLGG